MNKPQDKARLGGGPSSAGDTWFLRCRSTGADEDVLFRGAVPAYDYAEAKRSSGADMPDAASSVMSIRTFATALLVGLLWGIASAAFITAVAMIANEAVLGSTTEPRTTLRLTLEATTWAGMVASALAIFPIGPIAGVAGWLLYRRGVVAPWAYAGVGALSAAAAPVIVVVAAVETMRYPNTNYAVVDEGIVPVFVVGFALIGAFAGFMAGRVIRGKTTNA